MIAEIVVIVVVTIVIVQVDVISRCCRRRPRSNDSSRQERAAEKGEKLPHSPRAQFCPPNPWSRCADDFSRLSLSLYVSLVCVCPTKISTTISISSCGVASFQGVEVFMVVHRGWEAAQAAHGWEGAFNLLWCCFCPLEGMTLDHPTAAADHIVRCALSLTHAAENSSRPGPTTLTALTCKKIRIKSMTWKFYSYSAFAWRTYYPNSVYIFVLSYFNDNTCMHV